MAASMAAGNASQTNPVQTIMHVFVLCCSVYTYHASYFDSCKSLTTWYEIINN